MLASRPFSRPPVATPSGLAVRHWMAESKAMLVMGRVGVPGGGGERGRRRWMDGWPLCCWDGGMCDDSRHEPTRPPPHCCVRRRPLARPTYLATRHAHLSFWLPLPARVATYLHRPSGRCSRDKAVCHLVLAGVLRCNEDRRL